MAGVAVVFGGGGIVGLAWELGVVEGLREGGFDPAEADQVIGTSAGSIVGALLESPDLMRDLLRRGTELAPQLVSLLLPVDEARGREIYDIWHAAGMTPGVDERIAIAQLALSAPTATEDVYVEVFGQLLPVTAWPAALTVTSVSVDDGSLVPWAAASGVPLVRAVAASCALPGVFPPVAIDGRRYVDGGVRSPTSADLAAEARLMVAIAPDASDPVRACIERETTSVRDRGGAVVTILPDAGSQAAIGPDYMDVGRVDDAYAAGQRQGASAASAILLLAGRGASRRP